MKRIIITIILIIQIPLIMSAQIDETFETQIDKVNSNSDSNIQLFYERFNSWIESLNKDSKKQELNAKTIVNNFIIFSEDGLIMKDLYLHTVESCKNQILTNIPNHDLKKNEFNWIYVTVESHVNKK